MTKYMFVNWEIDNRIEANKEAQKKDQPFQSLF